MRRTAEMQGDECGPGVALGACCFAAVLMGVLHAKPQGKHAFILPCCRRSWWWATTTATSASASSAPRRCAGQECVGMCCGAGVCGVVCAHGVHGVHGGGTMHPVGAPLHAGAQLQVRGMRWCCASARMRVSMRGSALHLGSCSSCSWAGPSGHTSSGCCWVSATSNCQHRRQRAHVADEGARRLVAAPAWARNCDRCSEGR